MNYISLKGATLQLESRRQLSGEGRLPTGKYCIGAFPPGYGLQAYRVLLTASRGGTRYYWWGRLVNDRVLDFSDEVTVRVTPKVSVGVALEYRHYGTNLPFIRWRVAGHIFRASEVSFADFRGNTIPHTAPLAIYDGITTEELLAQLKVQVDRHDVEAAIIDASYTLVKDGKPMHYCNTDYLVNLGGFPGKYACAAHGFPTLTNLKL